MAMNISASDLVSYDRQVYFNLLTQMLTTVQKKASTAAIRHVNNHIGELFNIMEEVMFNELDFHRLIENEPPE